MKVKILALIVMIFSSIAFSAENKNLMSASVMKKAPVIDGIINEDEWNEAAETFGSRVIGSTQLEGRIARFYFGATNEALYFACKSELPPEGIKLLERCRKRDGLVYADDAVELIAVPPGGRHVYQIIVNPLGTFFDIKYKMENGGVTLTNRLEWQPKAISASRKENGFWSIELKIPLEDMETGSPSGKWLAQMTRDWKQPAQWTCWNKSNAFAEPDEMGEIIVSPDALVTKFKGLGNKYQDGEINAELAVRNPSANPVTLRGRFAVSAITAPYASDESKEIAPGQTKYFNLNFKDITKTNFDCDIEIRDSSGQKIFFRDKFNWEPLKNKKWNDSSEKKASLDFSFYPYSKTVKAAVHVDTLKNKNEIESVRFFISTPDGKECAAENIKDLKGKNKIETLLKIPELQEGKYNLNSVIKYDNSSKETKYEKSFTYKKFPWEHNQLGMEDIIVPPFKALSVNKEQKTVNALMTGYRIKNGLWDAIFAKGENILANPIELIINDGEIKLKEEKFTFTEAQDTCVKTETILSGKNIRIFITHFYDYDGMCKVEMELIPEGDLKINSAVLRIPVKNETASLMHATNNRMRHNPAQYIPDGKGIVWNSAMAKENPQLSGAFVPYFWMGGIYKGICWFTPSSKNWAFDSAKAPLEVVKDENSTTLNINIISKAILVKTPLKYTMGFQPTPVKPQMEGWRRITEHWKPKDVPEIFKMDSFNGPQVYGVENPGTPWPAGKDYSIVEAISKENRKSPDMMEATRKAFMEKHFSGCSAARKAFMEDHLLRGIRYSKNCDYAIPYLNARASWLDWDEYKVYMDEWWCTEYRANAADEYNNTPCRSYQDMMLYYALELVKNGFDGIYYDNIRDWPIFDPARGPAYEMADGKIQPYFDFFEMHELVKRTAVMLYLNKKTFPDGRPVIVNHMTNTNIIPFMSFSSIALDWEDHYGASDFQTRFSDGYILAESLGTQTGCFPEVLVKITGNDRKWVCRTFLATILVYDLPIVLNGGGLEQTFFNSTMTKLYKFGYGLPDTEIYPCWEKQDFVKCETANVKTALYKKTNEAVIVVSDFGNDGNVKLDISGLNFKDASVRNMETGEKIPLENGIIVLKIPKHDFRLILLSTPPALPGAGS